MELCQDSGFMECFTDFSIENSRNNSLIRIYFSELILLTESHERIDFQVS